MTTENVRSRLATVAVTADFSLRSTRSDDSGLTPSDRFELCHLIVEQLYQRICVVRRQVADGLFCAEQGNVKTAAKTGSSLRRQLRAQ